MPWSVVRRGSQYVVRKKDGEVVGSHGSKGEALAQQRALYANVHKEGGKVKKFPKAALRMAMGRRKPSDGSKLTDPLVSRARTRSKKPPLRAEGKPMVRRRMEDKSGHFGDLPKRRGEVPEFVRRPVKKRAPRAFMTSTAKKSRRA